MKNFVLWIGFICLLLISTLASASVSLKIGGEPNGEIRLGTAFSRTLNKVENPKDELLYYRLGFDISLGIASLNVNNRVTMALYEFYFSGTTYNFNEDGKRDDSLLQFGTRLNLGARRVGNTRWGSIDCLAAMSLLSMSVDTYLGPAWNPQVGISAKLGVVYMRLMYFGIISKGEKGYGIMAGAGFVYSSGRLRNNYSSSDDYEYIYVPHSSLPDSQDSEDGDSEEKE